MCNLIAVLGLIDMFIPDPLPYIDEILLIGMPLLKCQNLRPKAIALIAAAGELGLRLP